MKRKNGPSHDDWRRQGQESFLKNLNVVFIPYIPKTSTGDHDHCEFCGAKFSLKDDGLKEGYSTIDRYHWICEQCFNDFKDEFNWQVIDQTT